MQLIEYLLFAALAKVVQALPLSVVRWFARLIAALVFHVLRIRRSLVITQLRFALPEKDEEEITSIAHGSYVNLVTELLEMMWTPRLDDAILARQVRVRDPEVLRAALARGRGLVLLSGHFGNWEWMVHGAALVIGQQFTIPVHAAHNRRVDDLVEAWRTSRGNRITDMRAGVREIVRTLRARGIVALLADQSGPSGAPFVRFFNRPAATYEGPAAFVLKTGAAFVFFYTLRQDDGSYTLEVEEIPTQDLTSASDENLRELTRRHVRVLERVIRSRPDHWLWQHKRWKHTPGPDTIIVEDPSPA
jgi:Kdo2-lipid IVA lauroyltransferase/acyltransferase